MAFTKLSLPSIRTEPGAAMASKPETDIWVIFRALRDARSHFGLRPGHVQTLQAMLSFLRPGQGDTVFASNVEICRRVGGIDERTLRRHIDRFVELGFIARHDSPNRKRYRVRSSDGQTISYGLSLAPLLERASELLTAAQELENARRDCVFLRKRILAGLARLEETEPESHLAANIRRVLRRKLSVTEYRALFSELQSLMDQMSTAVDAPDTMKLPANDGQDARHQSMSRKEQTDRDPAQPSDAPPLQTLTATCDQAASFATRPLKTWSEVVNHARTLAPMLGIHPGTFEKAAQRIGPRKASCAVFIILQLGNRIRNLAAYFHSITLGPKEPHFDPARLLHKLARHETRPV